MTLRLFASRCSIKTTKHFVTQTTFHGSPGLQFSYAKRLGDIPVGGFYQRQGDARDLPKFSVVNLSAAKCSTLLKCQKKVILSTYNAGKPFGDRSSAPDPAGGAYSAPQTS